MNPDMLSFRGKVLTARGPVEPSVLGRVMMHEHLYSDCYDWDRDELVNEEKPISPERRSLLMTEAIPRLKECNDHECFAFLEATPVPWRAWPTFYVEASEAANMHIILSTGYYREMEDGAYWVKKPEDKIWPFVTNSTVEELTEFCTREIAEGIHGTEVRAGVVKLGTSQPEMTETEKKAFRAGARAQQATGVHITTHCTRIGAETSQLQILDEEGVDLSRVVIGHTAGHLMDEDCRKVCIEWMRRGANFLPTNLGITDKDPKGSRWQPLVEAIHEIFDIGLGDRITFGLDWAYCSEHGEFSACTFMPPPPYLHMFSHTLPAFRKMGLTVEEEEAIMRTNPQRVLPVL
jgi:phosphotriesterase-related protein